MSRPSAVSERTRRALQELGLTEYETRAYITLVEKGPMTASELSEVAQVPYSKVYDILGSLKQKDFIIILHEGRPARYAAKSPATALEAVRLSMERRIKEREEVILSELMPIYEGRGERERPDIWILRGETSILEKIKEVATRSERELLIAAPILNKGLVDVIQPLAGMARTRGCEVRIMVTSVVDKELISRLANVASVRARGQMFGGGVIADSREVVIVFTGEGESADGLLAIWSDHPGLAKYARNYFDYLWNDASPV
ncbi:MAG TPA: TrmB family transcriptional regulator [Candidatus Caldiarchaeum subterraneum]|uniref:TrmB family transcriptional regulator n=1 Tax=Caldiarchaeum subterraneum TaxID=311458 RepID=A0A832ZUK1_CALS0|nr:TrmB family transcriptional regulator [Aigarchaeota archaeon]HIQ29258.1 TrmB family transcriptional regulator [Candidatus Caldarchaeum subterraneum]